MKNKKYLTNRKNKLVMANKILTIILICFVSCKNKENITFLPNTNILINDLKDYEKDLVGGLYYKKRVKDTLTTYGFCPYLKTNCNLKWEIFFSKKDSLKIYSLLEKKNIQLTNPYIENKWLTTIKHDTIYTFKNIDRNILYIGGFEDYGDSCSIFLTHRITLYNKDIDFKVNYHPYYNDSFNDIIENK